MATADARGDPTADGDPDPFFGFVVGLYAAVLLAPAATIGVAVAATTDAAVLFFAFLGVGVAVLAAGWRTANSEAAAVRLGGARGSWLLPTAGLAYAAVLAIDDGVTGPASGVVTGLSLIGTLGALVAGVGLVFAAHNRHAKAAIAGSERRVQFSARGPERDRRLAKWGVGALMLGGTVGFAASLAVGLEPLRWLFHLMIGAGAGLAGASAERTYVVADAGVRVGTPVHKRVKPWASFDGYSLTDEALVLRRSGWSMRGLRDVRLDRGEIEDLEAVTAVLDDHLPQRL